MVSTAGETRRKTVTNWGMGGHLITRSPWQEGLRERMRTYIECERGEWEETLSRDFNT